MTGFRLTTGDPPPAPDNELWRKLRTPPIGQWEDPSLYIPADQALLDAVNTALWLGQPLLVTGEPGCGKTQLANHLAWRLGLSREVDRDEQGRPIYEHALRFDTKSETRARDLFYTIDMVERFHAGHFEADKKQLNALKFIRFQALGRAILYARPKDELATRLGRVQVHPGTPRRSVVLIDEIDKAPRDVPNDLLMEIEKMQFFMPEMNLTVAAPRGLRPILVITSNSEKALPDAFLRRCIYYHMSFPSSGQLRKIVAARIENIDEDSPLLEEAVETLEHIRTLPLRKKPATAELLGFVRALLDADAKPQEALRSLEYWESIARVCLLKSSDDQGRAIDHRSPEAAR